MLVGTSSLREVSAPTFLVGEKKSLENSGLQMKCSFFY